MNIWDESTITLTSQNPCEKCHMWCAWRKRKPPESLMASEQKHLQRRSVWKIIQALVDEWAQSLWMLAISGRLALSQIRIHLPWQREGVSPAKQGRLHYGGCQLCHFRRLEHQHSQEHWAFSKAGWPQKIRRKTEEWSHAAGYLWQNW